jgi:hypothetical protein
LSRSTKRADNGFVLWRRESGCNPTFSVLAVRNVVGGERGCIKTFFGQQHMAEIESRRPSKIVCDLLQSAVCREHLFSMLITAENTGTGWSNPFKAAHPV